jgi:hypothetical protein
MEDELKKSACNIVAQYVYDACVNTHNFLDCCHARGHVEKLCNDRMKDIKLKTEHPPQ